jgi:hypothetical protein
MGLLNIFKRKSAQSKPEDFTLESLLQKSAGEPAYRTEFYKRLLSDELIVITQASNHPEGSHILEQDTEVNFVTYPDGKIPIFTSTDRIFDNWVVKEQVNYMQLKGEDLFELTKGATFVLNPNSDNSKELLPHEIEQMLNGTILTGGHKQIKMEEDTPVQIGQPANYPTEIIHSLKKLFSERPNIRAAYLGWIYNPSSGEPPHYIFGLDGEGDLQSITNEAGFTAKHFLNPNDIIDFIRIDDKGGLSDYFLKNTTPFYKR